MRMTSSLAAGVLLVCAATAHAQPAKTEEGSVVIGRMNTLSESSVDMAVTTFRDGKQAGFLMVRDRTGIRTSSAFMTVHELVELRAMVDLTIKRLRPPAPAAAPASAPAN